MIPNKMSAPTTALSNVANAASDIPNYSYADEMMSPREIGVKRDGSFDGIATAVAGVNYYADAIGFGSSTGFAAAAGMEQTPLGIRFFTNTGMKCSNGADMYEYVDTVPKGTLVGKRLNDELGNMNLPQLRGLAPGIMEDAASALDPRPMLTAATGSGYAKCKKLLYPVGDGNGNLKSRFAPSEATWIKGTTVQAESPSTAGRTMPHQTRWIFDSWISKEEYDATPKTESALSLAAPSATEAYTNYQTSPLRPSQWAALAGIAIVMTGLCVSSKRPLL
jgi:hypothetical protein